jgi:hypothetical protein
MANIGEGKDLSAGEFAMDVGLSTALPGVGAGLKKYVAPAITKAVQPVKQVLREKIAPFMQEAASQLTGISKDGINLLKTKQGRQLAIEKAGMMEQVGDNLITLFDKTKEFVDPVSFEIKEVLEKAPPINIDNIAKAMHKKAIDLNLYGKQPHEKSALKRVESSISGLWEEFGKIKPNLKTKLDKNGNNMVQDGDRVGVLSGEPIFRPTTRGDYYLPEIPATEYYRLRKRLDVPVPANREDSGLIEKALAAGADEARNTINKVAVKDGRRLIDEWHELLQARDELQSYLGSSDLVRRDRIVSFLNTMNNRAGKKKLIQKLDDLYGTDFIKQTELVKLSDEVVRNGKIPVFPTQSTGRSTLGPGLAMKAASMAQDITSNPVGKLVNAGIALGTGGLSSPAIAPRMIAAAERGNIPGAGLANLGVDILNNPYLQRTIPGLARIPIQQQMGNK